MINSTLLLIIRLCKTTPLYSGFVTFEDVFEDQYSLYAEAEGHSSYSAVILVTSEKTDEDIFLQRVAVKYTWTVTPTTVEDKYVITLESTFETHVICFLIHIFICFKQTLHKRISS